MGQNLYIYKSFTDNEDGNVVWQEVYLNDLMSGDCNTIKWSEEYRAEFFSEVNIGDVIRSTKSDQSPTFRTGTEVIYLGGAPLWDPNPTQIPGENTDAMIAVNYENKNKIMKCVLLSKVLKDGNESFEPFFVTKSSLAYGEILKGTPIIQLSVYLGADESVNTFTGEVKDDAVAITFDGLGASMCIHAGDEGTPEEGHVTITSGSCPEEILAME